MNTELLSYYEAIEQASSDMLAAAKAGDWDAGRQARRRLRAADQPAQARRAAGAAGRRCGAHQGRIMQRILVNDAEIRHLAEPWLQDLDDMLAGKRKTLH
jgi:flagellar protein FliT